MELFEVTLVLLGLWYYILADYIKYLFACNALNAFGSSNLIQLLSGKNNFMPLAGVLCGSIILCRVVVSHSDVM